MPRTEGVSSSSRVRRILFSPRPISVSFCPGLRPAGEPVCVTRTLGTGGLLRWRRRGGGVASRRANSSDTFLPRRFATDRGDAHRSNAANVALTMLCGLRLPSDFATTSPMPSVSNTARSGPPAMMPVPATAVRSTTLPAPKRPSMSWCKVRPSFIGTRIRPRLARSVALRIASGTSRALPAP